MKSNCYIVGISGGTCSGKTTLARGLHESLGGSSVYISQDSYYKDQSHKSEDEIKQHNFDHPESLDLNLLYKHIIQLRGSKEIEIPNYCFKTHSRKDDVQVCKPATIVIVEGILIFSHAELRDAFDMRVFVDVDSDIRLTRRIKRDCLERGRDMDSILDQYLMTVKPMHDEFVECQKTHSEVVIGHDDFSVQQKNLEGILLSKITS